MGNGNGNSVMVKADRATVMGSLSERYSMDPSRLLETIKATCIKGSASNEQVQAFLIVANRYGLDPFLKEIHAFAGQGGGIVPIVGIDGWSKIANSRPDFDGCDFTFEGDGDLMACTATVYVKDRSHPVRVTEYMSECGRNTPPWKQYPRRMLRHKAFMQCVRIAFGLGGIYDEDEAKDVINNESGGTTVSRRVDALNAAVVNHPTDETRTIDTRDANLPDAEQVIAQKAQQVRQEREEIDTSGADTEPLPTTPAVDLTSEAMFIEAVNELAMDKGIESKVVTATVAKLRTGPDDIVSPRRKSTDARNRIYAAMAAGNFVWAGEVK